MPNSLDRRVLQCHSQENSQTSATKISPANESKPHQHVKRSKSMKVLSKPVAFLFSTGSSGNLLPSDNIEDGVSRLPMNDGISKSEDFLKTPKFDFENVNIDDLKGQSQDSTENTKASSTTNEKLMDINSSSRSEFTGVRQFCRAFYQLNNFKNF